MAQLQRIVLVAAALLGLGMLLYPPWIEFLNVETGFDRRLHGYRPVWDKPADTFEPGVRSQGVRLWSSRLAQQLFGLGAATWIAYGLAGRPKRRESRPPGEVTGPTAPRV